MLDIQETDPRALSTNEIPPDDDRNQLISQRAAAQSELALLEAQMALTELELDTKETSPPSSPSSPSQQIHDLSSGRRRRKKLLSLIAACDAALAPHKYLPAELLAYIFTLAFNGAHFPTPLPPTHRSAAGTPLALCHTCSRWRKAALNTPELWTDVVLLYTNATDPYRTIDRVEEWFTRSGPAKPLSLTVSRWAGRCAALRDDHDEVLRSYFERLVLPYAGRFRRLDLCLAERELAALLRMSTLCFPSLESICLAVDRSTWPPHELAVDGESPFFNHAPQLSYVELNHLGRRVDLWTSPELFRCEKLACIRCTKTSLLISECHRILRSCRNLVDCQLEICGLSPSGNPETPTKPIELLLLRSLTIELNNTQPELTQSTLQRDVEVFFEPLSFPDMKDLCICFAQAWKMRMWPHHALMAFLTRSCCELEALQITNADLDTPAVVNTIGALPSLKVLRIGVDNVLPRTALPQIGAGELLPRLECLVCGIDDLENAIAMLERRWESATNTKSIDNGPTESESTSSSIRPSCPNFVMVEYVGARITNAQAVRVDRLRANGIGIDMTRAVERTWY